MKTAAATTGRQSTYSAAFVLLGVTRRLGLAGPRSTQMAMGLAVICAAFALLSLLLLHLPRMAGSRTWRNHSLLKHGMSSTSSQNSGCIRLIKAGRTSGPTEQQVRIEHLPLAPALCRVTSWARATVGMRIEQLLQRTVPSLALPVFPQPHQPILEVIEFSCTALRLEALPTDTRVSTARICRSRSSRERACLLSCALCRLAASLRRGSQAYSGVSRLMPTPSLRRMTRPPETNRCTRCTEFVGTS